MLTLALFSPFVRRLRFCRVRALKQSIYRPGRAPATRFHESALDCWRVFHQHWHVIPDVDRVSADTRPDLGTSLPIVGQASEQFGVYLDLGSLVSIQFKTMFSPARARRQGPGVPVPLRKALTKTLLDAVWA
jgi:hypothetical protein